MEGLLQEITEKIRYKWPSNKTLKYHLNNFGPEKDIRKLKEIFFINNIHHKRQIFQEKIQFLFVHLYYIKQMLHYI